MSKLTIHFDNRYFENSHGKTPKGRGRWIFAEILHNGQTDDANMIEAPCTMTLGEAKKWLKSHLADQGVTGDFDVAVLP